MESWILWALAGYLVLQISIGAVVSRFIHSEADYLVAGRSLGTFLATVSIFATWFGAETVMGTSGAVAAHGLAGSRADPFGYTICLFLMGLLLARALRSRNYITVSDFFKEAYGRRNEVLASLIMIPTSLFWAAAQIQAFALILSTLTALPVEQAQMLSVAVVIVYTCLGGLIGDVIADLVQGFIVLTGLGVLLIAVISKAGGWPTAFEVVKPSQLSILAPSETWLSQLDTWAIPILGSLVAPEALSRVLATNNAQIARRACLLGGLLYCLIACIPVLIALIGNHLISSVNNQDLFLPTLVKAILPSWMMVIFLGALIAAILSTIDSTLLSVAGLTSHNIILPIFKTPPTEGLKVYLARGLVVISGLAAYGIATCGESIYGLVESASAFGSAGFLVCLLGGLYLPGISPLGAGFILLSGITLTVLFRHIIFFDGSFLATVASCTILYLVFRFISPKKILPRECNIHTLG